MPKNERNQNGRSNAPMDGDADALADSIRKAWTQKPSATKRSTGSDARLLHLVDGKI